ISEPVTTTVCSVLVWFCDWSGLLVAGVLGACCACANPAAATSPAVKPTRTASDKHFTLWFMGSSRWIPNNVNAHAEPFRMHRCNALQRVAHHPPAIQPTANFNLTIAGRKNSCNASVIGHARAGAAVLRQLAPHTVACHRPPAPPPRRHYPPPRGCHGVFPR